MELYPTTPKEINDNIKLLLGLLGLEESDKIYIGYTKEEKFNAEFENCHVNNMVKKKLDKGELVFGWIIWENKQFEFVEANFHSLWEDEKGNLYDITPRRDGEKEILFVRDNTRIIQLINYKGQPALKGFDNFRMVNKQIMNGIRPVIFITQSSLVYKYGLFG